MKESQAMDVFAGKVADQLRGRVVVDLKSRILESLIEWVDQDLKALLAMVLASDSVTAPEQVECPETGEATSDEKCEACEVRDGCSVYVLAEE